MEASLRSNLDQGRAPVGARCLMLPLNALPSLLFFSLLSMLPPSLPPPCRLCGPVLTPCPPGILLPSLLPHPPLRREEGGPGSGPGRPRSSCRARWLELFPGPRPPRVRGAAFVPPSDSLSWCIWQNHASGPGTAETLSLAGSGLGRQGALGCPCHPPAWPCMKGVPSPTGPPGARRHAAGVQAAGRHGQPYQLS